MSQIVDRIRVLNDQGDRLRRGAAELDFPAERLAHIRDLIGRLLWRADRIRIALVMLYLGFASFVLTSLALAADVLFANRLVALPTALAPVRRPVDACCLRQPCPRGPGGSAQQPRRGRFLSHP